MQSFQGTKTDPEQILFEGAKKFIESFKTPELAMKEAVDALHVINVSTRGKTNDKADAHYLFVAILQGMISPWIRADSTMVNDIAEGMKELCEYGGPEFFYESFISFLTCQILFEKEYGGHIDDNAIETMNGFRLIGNAFTDYDDAVRAAKREIA